MLDKVNAGLNVVKNAVLKNFHGSCNYKMKHRASFKYRVLLSKKTSYLTQTFLIDVIVEIYMIDCQESNLDRKEFCCVKLTNNFFQTIVVLFQSAYWRVSYQKKQKNTCSRCATLDGILHQYQKKVRLRLSNKFAPFCSWTYRGHYLCWDFIFKKSISMYKVLSLN